MTPGGQRPRVALLVNLVAPYRVALYDEMARAVDLTVLYSGHEDNRVGWEGAHRGLIRARARRVWGWVVKRTRPTVGAPPVAGECLDAGYLHVSPGYLADLVRERPDAIITSELGWRTMVALGYGLLAGIPVWVMIESTRHSERRPGRARTLVRGLIRRVASRWIAVGQCSAEYLRSLGVPPTRVTTIQGTVDERPFATLERRPKAPGARPVAVCVGQLVARKGISRLLEATATLATRGVAIDLLIAGDGPERARLEAQARALGVAGVSFLGRRTTDEVAELFRTADFLVFPTLEDVWGLVVNEALWSGLPVLASRYAGSAAELLPPGNIFDPLDQDGFVRALQRAASGWLSPADRTVLWPTAKAAQRVTAVVLADLGVPAPRVFDPATRP
ncbi:MAG: glycosyltransferase [Gemmatimonadales bacterium]